MKEDEPDQSYEERADSVSEFVEALDDCGITTAEYKELSSSLRSFLESKHRTAKEQAAFTTRDWLFVIHTILSRKIIDDDDENEDSAVRTHLIDQEHNRIMALQVLLEAFYKLGVNHLDLYEFGEMLALARTPVTLFLFENGERTAQRFQWPTVGRNA